MGPADTTERSKCLSRKSLPIPTVRSRIPLLPGAISTPIASRKPRGRFGRLPSASWKSPVFSFSDTTWRCWRPTRHRWTGRSRWPGASAGWSTGWPTSRRLRWLVPAACRTPGGCPIGPWISPAGGGTRGGCDLPGRTRRVGSRLRKCGRRAEERDGGAGAVEGPACRICSRPGFGSFGSFFSIEALAGDLEKRFPEDTFAKFTYVPVLRGLAALRRGKPADSVERLHVALPYELAANGLNFSSKLSWRSALGLRTRRGL